MRKFRRVEVFLARGFLLLLEMLGVGKASEIATEMTSAGDLVNFFSPVPGGRSDCRALTITVTKPENPLTARVLHSSSFFSRGGGMQQDR